MISEEVFEKIREKHGHYASWAVWSEKGDRPKSNIGNLYIFDGDNYQNTIRGLNPNIILVGLNISRRLSDRPFGNFHDGSTKGQDYKLRYFLKNTPFWGAYMTDIIKDFEQLISGVVVRYLNKNKQFEKDNIDTFLQEIDDLGVFDPVLVALGNATGQILRRNLNDKFKILQIPHYSARIKFEKYAKAIEEAARHL